MISKFIGLVTVVFLLSSCVASNNQETGAVEAVVQAYMTATYEGDVEGFKKIFHNTIVMNGYLGDQLVIGNANMFLEQMGNNPSLKAGGAPYKATIDALEVSGNVAAVTLNETGFGDKNFTNYLHLLKENGEWTIISKTFTTK